MLKKLVIALFLVLCLAGGAIWYAITNASALIARFKPQIEAAASNAAGAPVSFGELDTAIFPDTRVVVDTVSVGGEKGLSLRDLSLHLDLWALLGKRLEITELTLNEPTLTFIKDASGVSLEGLPKKGATPAPASTPPNAGAGAGASDAPSTLPLAIKLEKFVLRKATVVVRDTIAKTERRIAPLDVDASLDLDGSTVRIPNLVVSALLDGKLPISVTSSELAFDQAQGKLSAPNVRAEVGGIPLQVASMFDVRAGSGDATVRSAGVDLAKLRGLGDIIPPAVTALGLTGVIAPNIKAVIAPAGISTTGTVGLKDVALTSGGFAITKANGNVALKTSAAEQSIESKDLALALNGEPVTGSVSAGVKGTVSTLQNLALATAGGKILSSGSIDNKTQSLQAKIELTNLDVARVLAVVKPGGPRALSGKLTRFQTSVTGKMGPKLMESLTGSGSLLVNDGKLAGENIGGKVLKTATKLPFLTGTLFESLPPETKRALDAPDTTISSLGASFTLGGGAVTTKDLALKSSLFDIGAQGRASFAGALDLGATITFEKGLSESLGRKVKEVQMALDKDGRLPVPLTIKGTAPNLSVMPDFAKLLQGSVGKVIEQKAGDALNKLLQGKKGSGKGLGGVLGF